MRVSRACINKHKNKTHHAAGEGGLKDWSEVDVTSTKLVGLVGMQQGFSGLFLPKVCTSRGEARERDSTPWRFIVWSLVQAGTSLQDYSERVVFFLGTQSHSALFGRSVAVMVGWRRHRARVLHRTRSFFVQ